jgi:hypothetical protein
MLLNFILSLLIPVIFIALGFGFWKHPPGEINPVAGWRTARAKRSQQTWDFANKLAGKCTLLLGVIELAVTLIVLVAVMGFDPDTVSPYIILLVLIQSAFFAVVYADVERELKRRFPD